MSEEEVEALAESMHYAYEDAAVEQGWQTQERSRVLWADVPEANKATMRAMIRAVVLPHDDRLRAAALAPVLARIEDVIEATEWDDWGGRTRLVHRLRVAAGTPTHHTTEEDADE